MFRYPGVPPSRLESLKSGSIVNEVSTGRPRKVQDLLEADVSMRHSGAIETTLVFGVSCDARLLFVVLIKVVMKVDATRLE
jgi:hypothetical protein